MVIDSGYIQELRRNAMEIPEELAEILIDRLGEEPEPYTFTEQDLWEQARKLIMRYGTPKGQLELVYGVDQLENQIESLHSQILRELSRDGEESDSF
jgi:hypothetical protein